MTLQGGTEQKLDKLLPRELQYFDLVRDMDEVPEFVSPDILRWNALMNHRDNMDPNTPMHDKLDCQHADRGLITDLD